MVKRKTNTPAKSRTTGPTRKAASKRSAEDKLIDEIERTRWPEIKRKIDKGLASLAQGKGRKWNLDRFLSEMEKRRRAKLAAE